MANSMPLVERFIRKYGLDAEPNSRQVQEWVQGVNVVAKEAGVLVTVCDLTQELYSFQEAHMPELDYLGLRTVSVKELKMLIHPGDRDHFTEACIFGLKYFVNNKREDADNLTLMFECRVRDRHYQYHNVLFKYRIMGGKLPGQQPALVLRIAVVKRKKVCIPPKGIYIVDTVKQQIVKAIGKNRLTNHEIEKYRKLKLGYNLGEAAEKACVSYSSFKRYRQNLYAKTGTSSDFQLSALLKMMNLN